MKRRRSELLTTNKLLLPVRPTRRAHRITDGYDRADIQALLLEHPLTRGFGAPWKGGGPLRVQAPPGSWFAPPGSNRSSRGGNELAEASGVEGREGDSA